jgi:hypothetical protein
MEYRLFTDVDGVEHIIIDREDGSQLSMTKEHWDELEAAKENGTIS